VKVKGEFGSSRKWLMRLVDFVISCLNIEIVYGGKGELFVDITL